MTGLARQLPGLGGVPGQPGKPSEADREREEKRQQSLERILTKEARQRLTSMALVKEGHVRAVEDMLLRMAASGQLRRAVTDDELKSLLKEISEKEQEETKIVFSRKESIDSDEDSEYDFE
ncbi:hypothetical protein IWQ56_002393 [Coemansia nantahalensis]|uniref:Uncharacterized protein n=2 Tax=Coemansia TaxID=4863 RepID=A0ACC1LDM5_9FUNG|nr:hypothetical protein IWQ56_002393 [Coemansia nantahalensis]KAJ2772768.1 hypothetical protein IWQ57_001624 [Coemansia nantahalensis]KAJ2806571.1 hypothetical protein H4R21_000807 [Coemansia helicoidea]